MTTATAAVFATTLPMPTTVRTFFDTLRTFGTIKGLDANYNVTLNLPGESTDASLGERVLLLGQALGQTGIGPAFPTGHPMHWNPSYRWAFDEPVYAGNGEWSVVVPTIDDLRHVLDTVTGLAGFDRTYAGEPVLPVTYHVEDPDSRRGEKVMTEDLRSIEDEIESFIGERVCFTDPQPLI